MCLGIQCRWPKQCVRYREPWGRYTTFLGSGPYDWGGNFHTRRLWVGFSNLTTAFGTQDAGRHFLYSSLRSDLATKSPTSCPLDLHPVWDTPMSRYAYFQGRLCSLHRHCLTDSPALTFETVVPGNGGLGPLGGDCPSDVVFAVKVGAMYRALPWLTVEQPTRRRSNSITPMVRLL